MCPVLLSPSLNSMDQVEITDCMMQCRQQIQIYCCMLAGKIELNWIKVKFEGSSSQVGLVTNCTHHTDGRK